MSTKDPADGKELGPGVATQRLRDGDTGVGIPQSEGVEGAERLTDASDDRLCPGAREGAEAPDKTTPTQRLRDGDTGVGIPSSEGIERATRLTDVEAASVAEAEAARQRERFKQQLQQLEAVTNGLRLPPSVLRLVTVAGVLLAAVLGLLLATQVAALIADLQMTPTPWGWILGGFGSVCAGVLLWMIYRLFMTLLRLRRNPAVNAAAVQALQQRSTWQRFAIEHAQQAEAKLREYLEGYALEPDDKKRLTAAGLKEEEFDDLVAAKRRLLDVDSFLPPADWLRDFVGRFQRILDGAARRCARSYGTRVAVGTAMSPIPVVDQAIVLYTSVRLVRNLLELYNVRPAFGQTATILARAIIQTYLAGEIERLAEEGINAAADALKSSSDELFGSALGVGTATPFAAKFAEGATNGLLVFRLGNRTRSFLQPVRESG